MSNTLQYVQVAPCIPLPLGGRQSYTYHEDGGSTIQEGSVVRVPFGKRQVDGVVLQTAIRKPRYPTKAVTKTTNITLTPQQMKFGQWIARHMCGSLGYTLRLFIV